MSRTRRALPAAPALLAVLVAIQALSGLGGGAVLVADPSGGLMGMPLSVLRRGPFADFLVPGLALLLVLGVLPAITAVGLWSRPRLPAARPLERAFGEHWAWICAVVVGMGLLIWLAVELWVVGASWLLVVYAVLAFAVLVLAWLPTTRRFYRAAPRGFAGDGGAEAAQGRAVAEAPSAAGTGPMGRALGSTGRRGLGRSRDRDRGRSGSS